MGLPVRGLLRRLGLWRSEKVFDYCGLAQGGGKGQLQLLLLRVLKMTKYLVLQVGEWAVQFVFVRVVKLLRFGLCEDRDF